MAKYELYGMPNDQGPNDQGPSGQGGYVLDVQTDLLDGLNTRVVVPLMPVSEAPTPARRLNPVFVIGGRDVVMVTQFMSAVPLASLGPVRGSLSAEADTVTAALDMLMQGF